MISLFAKFNDRIVQLPVNPKDLTINGNANNKTSTMVGQGELNDIGYSKLKELQINSFFPIREASYVNTNNNFEKPDFYIKFFEDIKEMRKPFRLIVTELDINILVSIEGFEYKYQHGTDDVDYKLKLKEYREHTIKVLAPTIISNNVVTDSTQKVIQSAPLSTNSDRAIEKATPKIYIVIDGDSLWKIAKRLLGDGDRWNDIYTYNNNKKIIGNNPRFIKAGMELSIPS